MVLNELFKKSVEPDRLVSTSEEFHAHKLIGGRTIRFTAYLDEGVWDVEFAEEAFDDDKDGFDRRISTKHGMTGSGQEIEVMGFVMSSLETFIKKQKPKIFKFSADTQEESRLSLYKRMLRKYAKDYTVQQTERRPLITDVTFTLTKKATNESLNSKVPYEVKRESSGQFKTQAEIGGRTIVFRAELDRGPEGEYWDVSFEEPTETGATYGMTGKGKAFEVLSMVTASLTEFRDRYHPAVVHYTADRIEGSARANVYRRLVGRVLKNYEVEEQVSSSVHTFIYRRESDGS